MGIPALRLAVPIGPRRESKTTIPKAPLPATATPAIPLPPLAWFRLKGPLPLPAEWLPQVAKRRPPWVA